MRVERTGNDVIVRCDGFCTATHKFTDIQDERRDPEREVLGIGWSVRQAGIEKKARCPSCTGKHNERMFGSMEHPDKSQR